jgi:hypothetical protein
LGAPFPSDTRFNYFFAESGSYSPSAGTGYVTDSTSFTAGDVEYNAGRTKALLRIDMSKLTGDDGRSYMLDPAKIYVIRVSSSTGAGVDAGDSTVRLGNGGEVITPSAESYSMSINTSITGSSIASSVTILFQNAPIRDGVIVTFALLDRFGDPVKIPGTQRDYSEWAYAEAGKASTKDGFTGVPAGRYLVRVSSPEFSFVDHSSAIEIRGGKGGGGGCDAGFGAFALVMALGGVLALRRSRG